MASYVHGRPQEFFQGGANPKCEARSAEHAKARSAEPRRREAPSQFGGEGFAGGVGGGIGGGSVLGVGGCVFLVLFFYYFPSPRKFY